jgi:hypothetical protein
MGNASPKPVQLKAKDPFDATGPHIAHHPVECGSRHFGSRELVLIEDQIRPLAQAAVVLQLLHLRVLALIQAGDSDVESGGVVHETIVW